MNPWLIVGCLVAVGVAGVGGYMKGDEAGQAFVQQRWDRQTAELAAQHAKDLEAARQKEQAMQASANHLRQEKDREIRNLNARAAALTNSLRERPTRPTADAGPVSNTASPGPASTSCTGAGLSREDAQFLAGEAARADELRAALRQCIAQYEAVKAR